MFIPRPQKTDNPRMRLSRGAVMAGIALAVVAGTAGCSRMETDYVPSTDTEDGYFSAKITLDRASVENAVAEAGEAATGSQIGDQITALAQEWGLSALTPLTGEYCIIHELPEQFIIMCGPDNPTQELPATN